MESTNPNQRMSARNAFGSHGTTPPIAHTSNGISSARLLPLASLLFSLNNVRRTVFILRPAMMLPEPTSVPPDDPHVADRRKNDLPRMAMLGTLASGLGHNLRNMVMPVLLRLDVLAASTDLPARAHVDLASIRKSIAHLQQLAEGLRLLSSDPFMQRDEPQVTRLKPWWTDVAAIVTGALPTNTVVLASFASSLPALAIPPAVLAQVVVSVLLDARQAMEHVSHPRVTLSVQVDDACAQITIAHNGLGMDSETLRGCFEPYSGSRSRVQPSGLGHAASRALMQRFGGNLTAASLNAEGATFVLHARRASGAAARVEQRVQLQVDDPRALAVVRMVVAQRRMTVVDAANSNEASVVICDADALPRFLHPANSTDANAPPRTLIVIGPPDARFANEPVRWVAAHDAAALARVLE